MTGGEPDWSAEWTAGKTTTANALRNPYAAAAAPAPRRSRARASPEIPRDVDAAGDTLYQTFCAVCHGSAGDAKGTVSSQIGAPSLLTARARALHRRLHLQHHPLRARRHAPLRRQGVPPDRPLGHREPRAEAAGAAPRRSEPPGGRGSAFPRRRARPAPPPRCRNDAHASASGWSSARSPAAIDALPRARRRSRRSSAPSSSSRRWRRATARPGLAAVPRQLALLHRSRGRQRGVRGGAEDHQRQVVRNDHPIRRGARSPSCRSRSSALVLIFTAGYGVDLRADERRAARAAALEGGVALARLHVRPAGVGLLVLDVVGLEADPRRSRARYATPTRAAGARRPPRPVRALDPRATTAARARPSSQ